MTGAYFDALAATYDQVWSEAAIGRAQRDAVWRVMDDEFHCGDRVLDIGCGTGVDAVHLKRRGVEVVGIDASAEMVHRAKSKGVDARHLPIESLRDVEGPFNGAISNFGALNCVGNLEVVAANLQRLIVPGGRVAICVMGPVCAWEIVHYAIRLTPRKALRRFVAHALLRAAPALLPAWPPAAPQQHAQEFRAIGELPAAFVAQPLRLQRRDSSRRLWPRPTDRTRIGELPAWSAAAATRAQAAIYYPTIRHLTRAFAPHFQLLHWRGIGLSVPPSYVNSLSVRTIARLAAIDHRIAHLPGLRALADHRLLVFQRL